VQSVIQMLYLQVLFYFPPLCRSFSRDGRPPCRPLASPPMFRNCNVTRCESEMKLIAPEDICIRGEAIIQNSKWTRKLSRQPKWFAGLGSWAARGKEIRVFSAFCSRLRAGYVKRVETIRLSSVKRSKEKDRRHSSVNNLSRYC
jgi:hypothetical protein